MSLVDALDNLADLTVSGVVLHGLEDKPKGPPLELPAMIINLNFSEQGFTQFTTDETGKLIVFVEHVLLYSRGNPTLDWEYESLTPLLAYLAALKADWTLGGELIEPLIIYATRCGPIDYQGAPFLGWQMRHRWVLQI